MACRNKHQSTVRSALVLALRSRDIFSQDIFLTYQMDDMRRSVRQLDALERVLVRTLTDDMRLVEKLAVYPFIYRTMVVLKTAYGVDIGGLGDGKVGAWMDDMVHRQSCRTTSADLERFGQAMKAGGLDFFDYRRTSMFEFHPHLDT